MYAEVIPLAVTRMWLHVPVIDGEPLAGAAPSSHDFIGNHEDAVAIADIAQAREILGRRNQHAVDDRLDNDGGDIVLVTNHVFDVVDASHVTSGIRMLDGAVVAINFRSECDSTAFPAGSMAQRRGSPVAAMAPIVEP